jgi:hypothetical protein
MARRLTWAHAGDMGRLVADLRAISDYVFAEGEHGPGEEA